ncbi:hypothetical protein GW17_00027372 [Ensete ventricosum]|nr:hypothetical protein GW17_00027372 [Ensete ventricosum]
MTPLTSVSGDGQLYSPHQFQFPGAYYQQSAPPNMPYLSSSTPIPQVDLAVPIDQQGVFTSDTSNFNTHMFGTRPGNHLSCDSFGCSIMAVMVIMVKLEKGLEMLGIFKKHEYEVSIIDDFEFYEEREKAMQERKARKHHQMYNSAGPVRAAFRNDQRSPPAISGDFINRLSKNFINAVRLEERSNADAATDLKNSSLSASVAPKPDELQKSETTPATTSS